MKSDHQKRVEEFMRLARQEVLNTPAIPSKEVRELRAKLLYEECMEAITGLGVTVRLNHLSLEHSFAADNEPDLVEIVDGCCDLSVVATGTLSACGVPDLPFLEMVDLNNLAKFGPGHSWREDGKLIKPAGHEPPDLRSVINQLQRREI